MTAVGYAGYIETEQGLFTGACSVCGLHYNGAKHICPGPLHVDQQKELLGAQHIEEPDLREDRPYGQRLDEGFAMLVDSGW